MIPKRGRDAIWIGTAQDQTADPRILTPPWAGHVQLAPEYDEKKLLQEATS
ncbi:MAG: hypothetical protein KJZ78_03490 [Bryobacteraceae bacterium]|nr:hypothetical protein [Bryobacteraceae bacterium]